MSEQKKPLSFVIEDARSKLMEVRRMLEEAARENGFKEQVGYLSGLLTCGIGNLYHLKAEVKTHEIKVEDAQRGKSLRFAPRGIGCENLSCFICGETGLLSNIAAFVSSKEEGEQIVSWFGLMRSYLDYRPYEPHRIQLKVGACKKHYPSLERLYEKTMQYGVIREQDILDEVKTWLNEDDAKLLTVCKEIMKNESTFHGDKV